MKLIVSFLFLCFLVGALATDDHKHEPFGDDDVQAIEGKLTRALEMIEKLKYDENDDEIVEETILEDEAENGDKIRIEFRVHNDSMGDLKGNWEITCPNENQLKIKIEVTQTGMRQDGTVVSTSTNLVAPGKVIGKIDIKTAVIKWKQITGKLNMTVNLIDGKLSIDDLKSEINVPGPEVNIISEGQSNKDLEDNIAKKFRKDVLSAYEVLVKEKYIRKLLHSVLAEVELKRHGGEQSQQQSKPK